MPLYGEVDQSWGCALFKKVWFRPVEKQLAGNIARVRGQRSTSSRQDETSLERLEGCLGCVPPVSHTHIPTIVVLMLCNLSMLLAGKTCQERSHVLFSCLCPSKSWPRISQLPRVHPGPLSKHTPTRCETIVSLSHFLHQTLSLSPSLQPPQQSAAILESRLLQHVFSLCSGHSLRLRLTNWLEYALSYGEPVASQ